VDTEKERQTTQAHGCSQEGGQGGHGPSLNVKKEKIKKKFLEDTEKVKCLRLLDVHFNCLSPYLMTL